MTIHLPTNLEQALAEKARAKGVSVESLIVQTLAAAAEPAAQQSGDGSDAELEALLDALPDLPVLCDASTEIPQRHNARDPGRRGPVDLARPKGLIKASTSEGRSRRRAARHDRRRAA